MNAHFSSTENPVSQVILTEAFPFHIAVDSCSNITGCGRAIKRILPIKTDGTETLFDHFAIEHPLNVTSVDELKLHQNTFCLLKSSKVSKLILRGQLISIPEGTRNYFLVSPWVTELDILNELGLQLDDFPFHSPLSDFLILLQAQKTSLEDSRKLSADLSSLNADLEDRVKRRTEELERNTEELRASQRDLVFEMNERARVEIELRHAQKLESVGQLAAGIAHEINTPMQYIGNSLHFIESALDDLIKISATAEKLLYQNDSSSTEIADEKETFEQIDLAYIRDRAPKALDRALEGVATVSRIVKAMNEFTYPDGEEKTAADINRSLDTVGTVAKNEYKYVADLITDYQPLPPVECHIGDLNQVFLNLIVNAAHAIADNGTKFGEITISTRTEEDNVIICISDNGGGIPESIRHRVFDPFFTTKEVGRGTGQGLTISHNIIVNKHGGQLDFKTESGKGTTFRITLPISASQQDMAA